MDHTLSFPRADKKNNIFFRPEHYKGKILIFQCTIVDKSLKTCHNQMNDSINTITIFIRWVFPDNCKKLFYVRAASDWLTGGKKNNGIDNN